MLYPSSSLIISIHPTTTSHSSIATTTTTSSITIVIILMPTVDYFGHRWVCLFPCKTFVFFLKCNTGCVGVTSNPYCCSPHCSGECNGTTSIGMTTAQLRAVIVPRKWWQHFKTVVSGNDTLLSPLITQPPTPALTMLGSMTENTETQSVSQRYCGPSSARATGVGGRGRGRRCDIQRGRAGRKPRLGTWLRWFMWWEGESEREIYLFTVFSVYLSGTMEVTMGEWNLEFVIFYSLINN